MRGVLIGMTHSKSTHKLGRFIAEHKNVILLNQRPSRVENLFGLSFKSLFHFQPQNGFYCSPANLIKPSFLPT